MKVLKFGADWCPGCLFMRPRWQAIEKELPWLETAYFDYDLNEDMVEKYNIGRDIPMFIFLDKNENEFARMKGEISKKELMNFLIVNKDR